ncbi:MAG: type II toxin-antitoxin system YoeB family toxin [Candidatus Staskawiczbacteria bacterium]|nr:type II toxin-antitoxin system YoeB family toxin [Candidatus Staskawiczbacteria bacterium]
MTEIFYTPEFQSRYQELPLIIRQKAERREKIFRQNPFHSSLGTEKLKPKEKEYWSFRIDKSYRIVFRFLDNNKIAFLNCGHHNWIYRWLLTH